MSVHNFFSFHAIVSHVLQRQITHKTTPLRVVRIFLSNFCSYFSPGIVLEMHRLGIFTCKIGLVTGFWKL